jgi:hypothetical protein
MKSSILLIVILVLTVHAAFGQSIDAIKKRYAEVAEKARLCETDDEQGEYGELVMNELIVNSRRHQWRAVGIYQPTYKFFYRGGDSEQHLYPDQLVFVKTERRVSNRTYNEEFLFSDAGDLIFYYQASQNDDQTPGQRRLYFSRGKAIRVVEDNKTRDRLTAKDLTVVKDIMVQSRTIKEIFNRSIKL